MTSKLENLKAFFRGAMTGMSCQCFGGYEKPRLDNLLKEEQEKYEAQQKLQQQAQTSPKNDK